jgi:hypothetical protein
VRIVPSGQVCIVPLVCTCRRSNRDVAQEADGSDVNGRDDLVTLEEYRSRCASQCRRHRSATCGSSGRGEDLKMRPLRPEASWMSRSALGHLDRRAGGLWLRPCESTEVCTECHSVSHSVSTGVVQLGWLMLSHRVQWPLFANSGLPRRLMSWNTCATHLVGLGLGWCRGRCRTFLEYS